MESNCYHSAVWVPAPFDPNNPLAPLCLPFDAVAVEFNGRRGYVTSHPEHVQIAEYQPGAKVIHNGSD